MSMTSVSHLFPLAAHHYSGSIKKCVKLCNLKITILHPVTQNLMALRKMLFDSKLQLTWETNNSRCQWELWRTNKKLQNTSNIKKIQVGNISRRAVKRILQNIKDKPIWKTKEKKKNYSKIPFPPHSRSLRTRAERCQRIIDPVQKNAVYDVQQWRKKIK